MNIQKIIDYWLESSKRDFEVAKDLFKNKHYSHCLFFCHLTLEKILKALVVKTTKEPAPYTHDLRQLTKVAKLDLTSEQLNQLDKIFTFNIAGRYNDYKFKFYKKCTKEFTEKYFLVSKKLYLCLKEQLKI